MERERIDLNEVVDDNHPKVTVRLNSLSKQVREEGPDRRDMRLYGRCGAVSVNGPKKSVKGFAEYVDVEVDNIFDSPKDYSAVEDSTNLVLEHLLKIRLLAKDLGVSPGYLKLLEMLKKSTRGLQKKAGGG